MMSKLEIAEILQAAEEAAIPGNAMLSLHSAAIHICNRITYRQRLIWNYLLYRAKDELKDKNLFEISLEDLKKYLNYKKKDNAPLKKDLKALMMTLIEWNILGKGYEDWGAGPLLAGARIVVQHGRGVIRYSFMEEIRPKLAEPKMFARINLIMSANVRGKHAYAIYLAALDWWRLEDNFGFKNYTFEQTLSVLGLENGTYTPRELKRSVLKPSTREINSNSDLVLEITDIPDGRKISGWRFEMRVRDEFLPIYKSAKGLLALSAPAEAEPTEPKERKYPDIVAKFHAKYDVNTYAKPFLDALERAETRVGEDIDAYLVYVVQEIKKNASFYTNIAGFYVSQLDADAFVTPFKRQLEQSSVTTGPEMPTLSQLVDAELMKRYKESEEKRFLTFLSENMEEFDRQIMSLVLEHATARKTISTKYAGKLTTEAISHWTIFPILLAASKDFGYTMPEYATWRKEFLGNPQQSLTVEHIKHEAEKTLKEQALEASKRA